MSVNIKQDAYFFTAQRYDSAVYAVVLCLSVRHNPVLYRNDWTNRSIREKLGYFLLALCPKLPT